MRQQLSLALSAAFVLAALGMTPLGAAAVNVGEPAAKAPLYATRILAKAPVVFGAAATFHVGAAPAFVAAADLNRDGKPDLVTANGDIFGGSPGKISILLASGAGSFQDSVDYPVSGTPTWVAIGDLNGDGYPDLATANGGSDTVSVLLGKGDGTFGAKTDFAAPTNPVGIAIVDLNGDGKPDLAASSQDTNHVSVLLGNGNGTFGAPTHYPTGVRPSFVAAGDLNGDGKPDLVTGDAGATKISVLLGKGDGTLQPPVDYVVEANQYASVAIGDLNADGKPDLVASNHDAESVSVLLGNGDGTFRPAVNYRLGMNPHLVVLGDMNGDGIPDLVTGNHVDTNSFAAGGVSLLLGRGDGTFDPAVNYPTGASPLAVAVADFNGDGRTDLAAGNFAASVVSLRLNLGVQALKAACVVPNVRGKTLSAASKKIKAAHCRVGKVRRAYSKTVVKGRVVSEKPKPKTKLASGGKVNLVVSRGRKH
jgi:hypothetical protein